MAAGIRKHYLLGKRFLKQVMGKEIRVPVQVRCAQEFHGSEYGGWSVCNERLNQGSIVYSFGLGDDITFDLSLIEKYGLQVFGFDPTPRSIEWLKSQSLPPQFQFQGFGIGSTDRIARFFPPKNPSFTSFTTEKDAGFLDDPVELPIRQLSTICKEFGHEKIDILKMDVEGAEYDVIPDILQSSIQIDQILVEFHHRFEQVGKEQTLNAIRQLEQAGYKLFSVSPSGIEYGFVKQ